MRALNLSKHFGYKLRSPIPFAILLLRKHGFKILSQHIFNPISLVKLPLSDGVGLSSSSSSCAFVVFGATPDDGSFECSNISTVVLVRFSAFSPPLSRFRTAWEQMYRALIELLRGPKLGNTRSTRTNRVCFACLISGTEYPRPLQYS